MDNKDWIRIEDLSRIKLDIPKLRKFDPRYIGAWRNMKKKLIEGIWMEDFGRWRYVPHKLLWYGNFGSILYVDKMQNVRTMKRPDIRDIEWERAYMLLEAQGFSGWLDDENYTSMLKVKNLKKSHMTLDELDRSFCFKKDGTFKEFIPVRENIRMLHDTPKLGSPMYLNNCKNFIELGSRGGGKSYWWGVGVTLHELIFDGLKYYDEKNPIPLRHLPTIQTCVGSGRSDKSGELVEKIVAAMDELAVSEELGTHGNPSEPEKWEPCPLYREMSGPSTSGNKERGGWKYEYKKNVKNQWIKKGTKSALFHVNYSSNKKEGGEAGAGGRYSITLVEEVGLTEKTLEAYRSNNGTVIVDGKQIGIQGFLGTSGNMETIKPARKIFQNPKQYNIVDYEDTWEGTGRIGFFLPHYMVLSEYKDKNGNTDIENAKIASEEMAEVARNSPDPNDYHAHRMNFPTKPSHMFVNKKTNILPSREAEQRELELLRGDAYTKLRTPVELLWDSNSRFGVKWQRNDINPVIDDIIPKEGEEKEGTIVIYDFPPLDDFPRDLFAYIGHDPYVSDNQDEGESLGGTYIISNPKYLHLGYPGNTIVAEYVGKPYYGKKKYYENQEKLIQLYGNAPKALWYEANRGEYCRGYYIDRGKDYLLCSRPSKEKGSGRILKPNSQTGFIVGNRASKAALLDMLAEWLLEVTEIDGEKLMNIERIPSIGLLREIREFNMDNGNFDRIMSLVGCVLGLRETSERDIEAMEQKNNSQSLSFFSNNQIFTGKRLRKRTI